MSYILQVDRLGEPSSALKKAAALLQAGGVIVFPTDTAYALGGRYDSPSVVRRVLAMKGRRDRKFTLVASSQAQVRKYFRLAPAAAALARRHWPGPLSIVVSPRFAVRVPHAVVARRLAQLAGAPLIATSANRTGGPTPFTVGSVMRQFSRGSHAGSGSRPDLIIDVGRLPKRKPSTIVRVDGRGNVTVIRAGAVNVFYRPRPG